MLRVACVLCATAAALVSHVAPALAAHAPRDLAAYVNPFNGTAPGAQNFGTGGGAGNTFPGAVLPFGMVQFSPDTLPGEDAFGGGYTYGDHEIKGFSLKHMSGPGCAAYQDFPVTPTTAPINGSPAKPLTTDLNASYVSSFSHGGERATPGSYEVSLRQPGGAIDAQLTASARTGAARFTFPRTGSASVLINAAGSAMGASEASVRLDPSSREITGEVASGQFCYQRNRYRLFFAARFSRPFAGYGTWRGPVLLKGSTSNSDSLASDPFVYQPIPGGPSGIKDGGLTAQTGSYVSFDTRRDRVVEVRIGISFVSVAGARANLAAESDGRSFAQLRSAARGAWDRALGRVRVGGGRARDRGLFYTQLYHALIDPSTFSDADGRYMGFDGRVHAAPGRLQYADFSGWDIYRTQLPLIAMVSPRRASDVAASLLADAQQSGYLPKWSQADDHTHEMVGDPADALIAGADAFGARDFDRRGALAAMIAGASRYAPASTTPTYYERPGLPDYLRLGYVPYEDNADVTTQTFLPDRVWGVASTTLEYALDDFTIARLAASLCDPVPYRRFETRSSNWRNVLDIRSGYVQPRYANGSFKAEAPTGGDGFVEGDAAQYTLFVPHDVAGLAAALGGRRALLRRLDQFFTQLNAGASAAHAFLGNEPTLDTPWLYDWLGEPYKTQRIARSALLSLYQNGPGGMPGNDDLGTMSAWWVLTALGVYPAVPGTDVLALGSPLFPHARVALGRGTLEIDGKGAAPGRAYVRAVRLNGKAWPRPWLSFRQLSGGGRLVFVLGSRPNRHFGNRPRFAPPSFGANAAPPRCRR